MVFRKDFAFLQVLVGAILIFIPIAVMFTVSPEITGFFRAKLFFTIVGLVCGGGGTYLIGNGYYKLTEKFVEYG